MDNDGSANLNGTLSAVRALLVAVGGVLAAKGLEHSGVYFWVETLSGSIMVIGPAVWGVVTAILAWHAKCEAARSGVVAGMALQAQRTSDETGVMVTPTLITHNDAQEIIKTFAPAPAGATK